MSSRWSDAPPACTFTWKERGLSTTQPELPIPFLTDDEIVRRVQQAEDGLLHIEYSVGVLKRELGELRKMLEPRPG